MNIIEDNETLFDSQSIIGPTIVAGSVLLWYLWERASSTFSLHPLITS